MVQSKQHVTRLPTWLVRHGYPELATTLPPRRRTLRRLMEEDRALAALSRERLRATFETGSK